MPQILVILWQIIKNLPTLIQLFKQLEQVSVDLSKSRKEKQNEDVKNDAENAKSSEEKQGAVDSAASRWGN